MNIAQHHIPAGYEPFGHSGLFADAIGPFYVRAKPGGGFSYAFHTAAMHANPNGDTHGGALFSFADHITGHAIVFNLKRMCATVKFKVEYLAPGPLDCLVEGEVEIVRSTRTMAFLRVRLFTGDRTLMTADTCYKLFAPYEPGQHAGSEPAAPPPNDDRPEAPAGFQPFPDQGAFPGLCGPVYYRRKANGDFINGFHARAIHDNTNGIVHGGVLFTFADDIIGRAASGISRRHATTVAMNVEYLSAGPLGAWIEGTTEVTHMDDGFAFIRARVHHEERIILTADGVCRLLQPYIKKKPEAAA
ncbi:MAG: PaaI family thioesterase [Rhodospirillaceae bacterium]|jgi:acyl-coenzyme A thioesterase PaaI-like protein|nr:PaaI family thioesterase [Rhodospirillaceae bacterium]MBT5192220.1 PaaI family thioesterase [Rhodospirillaceae bacterium]MBT5896292.1 PaaI family thioesterase [Rhodospirillaceae bacterium]MBT6428009.1 PaaI family thioesterase [Rhodospirillaceae bacterium]MBT7755991.1 PaaI family thioesterase [Rhodospirillaceae bacterium]